MHTQTSGFKLVILTLITFLSGLSAMAQTDHETADSYFNNKDYKRAAEYYGKVLKADTNDVHVLRNLGFSLMNLKGQQLTSAVYFSRIVKMDSADVSANYYLGVIYKKASRVNDYKNEKENFQSLSQTYLKRAAKLGSKEAALALKEPDDN